MSRADPAPSSTVEPPWYRQVWPWLLMLMPATALVGGVITFWLAATTNDSLVVDDYYKEGRAINRELARDRRATELGLSATLDRDGAGRPRLRVTSRANAALGPTLTMRLVHATRAELDRSFALAAGSDGVYTATDGALPEGGHWNIQIEEPERRWRLVASAKGFTKPVAFESATP